MKEDIEKAARAIREGKVILYPTDTIWGIGCDAYNTDAINEVYNVKKRPENKSFIILIHEIGLLQKYVKEIPEVAWDIIEYETNPLTVVFPEGRNLPGNLLNEDGSIAIRLVKDNVFCQSLLQKVNKPLVATSANISGAPGASHFGEIDERILNGVDYVVNWGQTDRSKSKPSKIIKLGVNGEIKFLRK